MVDSPNTSAANEPALSAAKTAAGTMPTRTDSCCGSAVAGRSEAARWKTPGTGVEASNQSAGWTATAARLDWLMWGSAIVVALAYGWQWTFGPADGHHGATTGFEHFTAGVAELMNMMWWGLLLGIVMVGVLDRVPRDIIINALGRGSRLGGIVRATGAGVAFDLCSHGILMVGMKLYERGASIGQTVAFLLASPWNSFSLTIVLIALIGWELTLAFIALSAVIGIVTGYVFDSLVAAGRLPDNPARAAFLADDKPQTPLKSALATWWKSQTWSWSGFGAMLVDGLKGSRMVLRWLLFGIVLASAIRAVVPADVFADWFGATMFGVLATIVVATIVEVCSEGSAPLAADLVARADAPGNGFTFLMAGVATDYTEIMSLKDTTGHWSLALALPLIAVPQTLAIGIMLNWLA